MDVNTQKLKDSMDEAVKTNTHIVLKPEDIEEMIKKNIGVTRTFTKYADYIEKLYKERKDLGLKLLHQLPALDEEHIGSAVISRIFVEIRESIAFAVPSSAIMNSMLLLEYAMRLRMYYKILESDKKFDWYKMEQMDFDDLIARLKRHEIIDDTELKALNEFKEKFRNTYFHMNVAKMAKGQTMPVDTINQATGERVTVPDMKLDENPALWFAAKVKFDRDHVFEIIDFCVKWTNKLLVRKKNENNT